MINCDVSLYSKVYSPPYCAYNSAFGYGSGIKKTVKKQQIIKIKKGFLSTVLISLVVVVALRSRNVLTYVLTLIKD